MKTNEKKILLPYGKSKVEIAVEESRLSGILRSEINTIPCPADGAALVSAAMEHPIGSPALRELAKGKKTVTVICSDHTRPVPSKDIVPSMLREIREGNPDAEITLLIATGLHRTTSRDELVFKFGEEIVKNEKIVIHDCDDTANLVSLGKLPSGGNLTINRLAVECDLLVSEGFIEPHFFAGFSGGRKSVLPGVSSRETVMYNHNAGFIASPCARTGVLDGNPIHRDMLYAAKAAKLAYTVNVVINADHKPIFAVAGDPEAAHKAGVSFLREKCRVRAIPADITVTTNGGYPLDQNIYQSVKGMTAAEACVREGGVIIMVSECGDGHGGKTLYDTFRNCRSVPDLMREILATAPENTKIDQWEAQILARIQLKANIVLVSSCDPGIVRDMRMTPARDFPEAMEIAKTMLRKDDPTVTVIPDGVSVIVEA